MHGIFISHSSHDNAAAERVRRVLREEGIESIFLDFDPDSGIPPGRDWERELYQQIRSCRAVVFLCSTASERSHWCFAEVIHARALGKTVIPVRIEATPGSLPFPDVQYVDLTENQEEGIRRLRRAVQALGLDQSLMFQRDPTRALFPGLSAFEEGDAGVFFGREDETRKVIDAVTSSRRVGDSSLLLLLGASGAGKSSVLRAGVLPRLKRDANHWIVVDPFRPGTRPLDEMSAALSRCFSRAGAPRDWRQIAGLLATPPAGVSPVVPMIDELRLMGSSADACVVMAIDQFEELLEDDAGDRDTFFWHLRSAAESRPDAFVAIGTLRSDYTADMQLLSAAHDLTITPILLGPMGAAAREQIITAPARLAGTEVDPGLVRRLLEDTESPDSLPLLAFCLHELYERRGAAGQLNMALYDEMGGIHRAIERVAEGTFGTHPESINASLEQAMLRLVKVNEQGRYVRRTARWDELPALARPALERLVRARLLVSRADDAGRTVEVAHEALFEAWDRLAEWLARNRGDLLLHEQIARAANLWEDGGRTPEDLWRGDRLRRAIALQEENRIALDPLQITFLEESAGRERDEQRKIELTREYRSLQYYQWRRHAEPLVRSKLTEIEQQLATWQPKRSYLERDAERENLESERSTLQNLLRTGVGRWHPLGAELKVWLGEYFEVYRFPCCDTEVSCEGFASRFREDGCLAAPDDTPADDPSAHIP